MRKCPRCGISLITLEVTRKVGCPSCYRFFRNEILPMLEEWDLEAPMESREPQEALIQSLKEAVDREEYEEAAKIRDKINGVEHHGESFSY